MIMHWAKYRASVCKSLKRPFLKTAAATSYPVAIVLAGLTFSALCGLVEPARAQHPDIGLTGAHAAGMPHRDIDDSDFVALRAYAQSIGVTDSSRGVSIEPAASVENENPHAGLGLDQSAPDPHAGFASAHAKIDLDAHLSHPEFAALRAYANEIAGGPPSQPAGPAPFKVAEADNALDALREMLRGAPQSAPQAAPSPGTAPATVPRKPPPAAPRADPSFVNAHRIGSDACQFCHAGQADSFGKTLMGRIARTQPAKLDCENCHGPASAHVQAVGCAPCHGEGGVSKKQGIPSLVGQDPQYLVPAMKAYVTGARRHNLMREVLSGVGDADLQNIARYYARQVPARAQTPVIGEPAAGKAIAGLCANCHGEAGSSVYPGWPSLAGQDAQYLTDAIKAYKDGSRSKAVSCAGCHGEGGISKRPGMPNLAGQDAQYLLPAMKAYVSGERKHGLMKILLTGVSEAELNSMTAHYARQSPARAQTPGSGDPSAGKSAAQLCVGCHGDEAGSTSPANWPSLAGQDAKYIAGAIRAYKEGSRNKAVACAGCHGERGISKKPGIPNLVGLSPAYLVGAMKDYAAGKRKHQVMNALLTGVSDTELNDIAQYYARQVPARAETPATGDAVAGKAASAACAGCHGPQGVSPNPAWPSLAGQDARYLAGALKGYKDGSRDNAMMKGFVAALDEKAMNDIASHFASLAPAQPAMPDAAQAEPSGRDPVLIRNGLVASLDDRAINDIAGYFASLVPAQAGRAQSAQPGRDPVVVRNGLVASLDDRAAKNLASYYASLSPEQPAGARNVAGARDPVQVSLHMPDDGSSPGGIVSFRKTDPSRRVEDNNTICLSCHERGGRTYWRASTHESRNVACTECHTVMQAVSRKANLKTVNEMDTCFQCHKDRRAQLFRTSHMPLREGKMVCSNCHNPHGSATDAMLIESSINGNCYKCHAEKRGPFLFEHAPVRENCTNCHDPHGTVNEAMLKLSRPRLCGECHTVDHSTQIAGGPKSEFGFSRACQNCHSKVHGSNSPSGALLQR